MSTLSEILRQLPPVDQVLLRPPIQELCQASSRTLVLKVIQEYFQELRRELQAGRLTREELGLLLEELDGMVQSRLEERLSPSLRTAVNATGVVIHTNVGRAPIAPAVAEMMKGLACSYSNLEFNLERGERGHRDAHFEARVMRLLGCEAATVCNNAAAALFLVLNTLARDKKVLVSRGELIEIGGSFRLPAIMESSGALLKEVGTTNKTRISDYREGVDSDTALILTVHPSNYRIVGFTERPTLHELVALAREKELPLVKDAGSGLLFPVPYPSLREEPSIQEILEAGVDLVFFSGDKLLGGPQAGLVLGRRSLVEAVRKNPLMRACRVDKVTYAALEGTLIEYEKGTHFQTLPVYRMLGASPEEIRERATHLGRQLEELGYEIRLREGASLTGGGSAPEEKIPTWLVAVRSEHASASALERFLRNHHPAVLARIEEDELLLDLRTVFPREEPVIVSAFSALAAG